MCRGRTRAKNAVMISLNTRRSCDDGCGLTYIADRGILTRFLVVVAVAALIPGFYFELTIRMN